MAEGGKMPVKLSILRHSSIVKDGDPCVYGIPMHQTLRDEDAGFEKLEFGCNHGYAESKVIMMVGETGSGKTTLINGLVNYVFGVDWNDSFRFKMIVEDSRANQAHSQTKDVTSYTLHHQDGFRMPYSLTIIDTPGFGDTKGIKRDREIVEQLRKFFTSPGDLGISHIDAIGFVVQASQARLSVGQKYVFDSILALFGKDISDNIFLLVTFADGQEPEVLNAVREAEIPHKHYFQFNNSALYSQTNKNRKFGSLFWEMGCESFQTFLDKVLEVEKHEICNYMYYVTRKKIQKTVEEVRLRYEEAHGRKLSAQNIIDKIQGEYDLGQKKILEMADSVRKSLERLREIALKPDPLSAVEYIDMMIKTEQRTAKPGWQERVEQLNQLRRMAEQVKKIETGNFGLN
ncbi:hypothetical protein O3P69_008795 [Scylla paramamosain]|uniref:Septin-type G domain-containing protein n=1 Tax=Scylla paramamosain TaxID=85552 RepID=A0AAW0TNP1_SCYPA